MSKREIKSKRISPVPVTPEEKKRFLALAEAKHTDLCELVRQLLHREADAILKESNQAA